MNKTKSKKMNKSKTGLEICTSPGQQNEMLRLFYLDNYKVLDTEPESAFDDLTKLAATICKTPIALISLVDENRQWFKSRYGTELMESLRDISFCSHAIQSTSVMIVKDALNDPRFKENPLVLGEPKVRFYAGAPLIATEGYRIGTLCILDYKPRSLTGVQIKTLECLARQTVAQMELRKNNSELKYLATNDPLTGVKNIQAFHDIMRSEFHAARDGKSDLSVALIDIDHLKSFNNAFGLMAGDSVLQLIGKLISSELRENDLLGRYSGEEYILLMPNTTKETAMLITEKIRKKIENREWQRRSMTVSIGVANIQNDITSPIEMIAHSEKALYRAKRDGRNRVQHYDDYWTGLKITDSASDPFTEMLRVMVLDNPRASRPDSQRIRNIILYSYDEMISSWARLLDLKDKETEGHCERVAQMTVALAHHAGMDEADILFARWGALLHDIGKIAVPDSILLKEGPLDDEEWKIMRQHPDTAYQMLHSISFLHEAIHIPYCHHERWDGTGYPRKLKGEEIPLAARLFSVLDVYDALRSDRPYRPGWSEERVRSYLKEKAGTQFDPFAVNAFIQMLEKEDALKQLERPEMYKVA